MRLAWTPEALSDRRAICDHIETEHPQAAIELDLLISEKASRLALHPEMGWIGRVERTRELVVHRNYILIYDLVEELVRVLRVLHTAQQWPPENSSKQ